MAIPAINDVNPAQQESRMDYLAAPVRRAEHLESDFTRLLEQQTAKIPSHVFLFLAMASLAGSLAFEFSNNPRMSRFVGMWTPTLLIMGVYNKLVKSLGTQ